MCAVALLSRLTQLDTRVLGRTRFTPAGHRTWVVFALLAVALLAVGAYGLAVNAPAAYGLGLGGGVGALVQAVALFVRRDRVT